MNRQAFTPSVEVSGDGSVAVSYYDLRYTGSDTDPNQKLETDRLVTQCAHPSITALDLSADSWKETRLTPDSFDLRVAPNSFGLFLGDYQALARAGNGFASVFTEANSLEDPATVYFASVP